MIKTLITLGKGTVSIGCGKNSEDPTKIYLIFRELNKVMNIGDEVSKEDLTNNQTVFVKISSLQDIETIREILKSIEIEISKEVKNHETN